MDAALPALAAAPRAAKKQRRDRQVNGEAVAGGLERGRAGLRAERL